ncbi:MAG: DNA repair protein RadC [Eubacteriales bacterium]|nr:DNA repair protein RadC [Eubacteriales bacterium]
MPKQTKIKDLPEALRPYERCEQEGPEVLSDAELLAVILRSGSREKNSVALAEEILSLNGSEHGLLNLMQYSCEEFRELRGVGRVKGLQLLCVGELSRRIWKQSAAGRLNVHDPATVADYYMEDLRHLDYECIHLMLLDAKDRLRKSVCVSRGSMLSSSISSREIFKAVIAHQACGLILVHNHPSGDPTPSADDVLFTQKVRIAAAELGIMLRDHVIIGDNCYFSFVEHEMLHAAPR